MTQTHFSYRVSRHEQQRGLTLIELMVAMVIGLVLAIVASSSYLYSRQSYSAVTETSQMEENGRYALTLLARNIQNAGYVALDPKSQLPQAANMAKMSGCDFGMVNPKGASSAADLACASSTPAGTTRSASIAVFYDTDPYQGSSGKLEGFDCLGNEPVVAPPKATDLSATNEVRNYFFVSTSSVQTPAGTTTMGQLSCSNNPTGTTATFQAQPLIPGVHQFNVTYLTASTVDKNSAQTRKTAAEIALMPNQYGDVAAVELCVLTKSVQPSGNDSGTPVTDCFGNTFTPPIYQSFRRFTTTVNIRNRTLT